MKELKMKSRREEVTVLWQPHICAHSGICARGLPAVFDPKRKPWIDMNAADLEMIKAQVLKCPSGALSLIKEEGE